MVAAVALVLVAVVVPLCLVEVFHGDPLSRLVALEALAVAATLELLLMSRTAGRSPYVDVALVLAVLTFAGSLVFARFWGREL
ncbi:MrpF/PhaF family protein [Nocardioides sp. KR10-350]|uniref:MrpF/PhaF family protein n=1 Tax=Nocardioides cheoyonin TaxID=3156615 RepID=UPI0032B5190F